MTKIEDKGKKLTIEFDTAKMSPSQIRAIKTLSTVLPNLVLTYEETEFFEGSAECMRMCASLIKQSRFVEGYKSVNDIPYANQAIEYSIDILQENIEKAKIVQYDN